MMLGWFIAVALASGIVGWCAGYTTAADRFDARPRYGIGFARGGWRTPPRSPPPPDTDNVLR